MDIVYCSAEVAPFSKAGGLGDVAQSFPVAMNKLGHNIIVLTPLYSFIKSSDFNLELIVENATTKLGNKIEQFSIYRSFLPNSEVAVYFIKHPYLYRDGIYVSANGEPYLDAAMRFIFFSKAIFEVLKKIQFQPDIIHANDWHTGIVPYYLKSLFKSDPFFAKTKTVFTIHNIGYQGVFEKSDIQEAGVPPRDLEHDFLMWGKVNLMKVGTVYADVITTVSEKYSKEIQSPEYGHGLEVIIRSRASDLYGIINGVDYSIWNPSTDPLIPANYSVDDLTGKKKCKEFLQKKLNLKVSPAPIIAIISRLDYQKGLDLVLDVFDDMMALNVQFVLLGTGDKKLEREFAKKAEKYSSRCSINIEFNNELAHQIEAGADIFLMPSRYEPCGLNQMYSMIYGTIPIVRKTGGLADTVIDYTENPNEGTGFVFEKYNNIELYDTVKKAVELYKHSPEEWQKLQTRAMSKDFSWQRTAIKIERIYKNLLN